MRPLPDPLPTIVRRATRGDVTDRVLAGPTYRRLTRGAYQPAADGVSFEARLLAARDHLPSGAVLCGSTAAWVHGVSWFTEPTTPIELALPHAARVRCRSQLVVRARSLHPDDVVLSPWGPVTTVARTAYDLARNRSVLTSVPRLDALARTPGTGSAAARRLGSPPTGRLDLDAVARIVERNAGARWIRRVPEALDLVDAGAESPRESALRVRLALAGLPRLETQIPVVDGARTVAWLDMGWRTLRLGIEYDGAHHDDPNQVARDRARLNAIHACGWRVLLVDRALFAQGDRLLDQVVNARRQMLEATRPR